MTNALALPEATNRRAVLRAMLEVAREQCGEIVWLFLFRYGK